jgi:hypothetical protein
MPRSGVARCWKRLGVEIRMSAFSLLFLSVLDVEGLSNFWNRDM